MSILKSKMKKSEDMKPNDLGIAYSVKRKKKKMAEGGAISASDEKRPMPSSEANDRAMVSRNSDIKVPHEDSWTDKPTERQAKAKDSRKTLPIKHPKMVPTNAFSVRLRDQEDDLQSSKAPGPYGAQPPKADDEEMADAHGDEVPDMQDQHNNGRKPYAKGGEINDAVSMKDAEEDNVQHPEGLESDDDQMAPSEDEFMAGHFAEGGEIHDEEEIEHAASLAAAIMAKRRKFARGGAILSEDSMESDDSSQADLARNAEEDANMEDKASFNALRKENYSESAGLRKLDQPRDSNLKGDSREDGEENIHDSDIVSAIRRKMKIKSAITR